MDISDEGLEKMAKELTEILPEKGGTRIGMQYDILHFLEEIRDAARAEERDRCARIAESDPTVHAGTSVRDMVGAEIARTIRQGEGK